MHWSLGPIQALWALPNSVVFKNSSVFQCKDSQKRSILSIGRWSFRSIAKVCRVLPLWQLLNCRGLPHFSLRVHLPWAYTYAVHAMRKWLTGVWICLSCSKGFKAICCGMQWFKGTITSNWDEYLKLVVMYHYGIICDPLSDNPAHPTFLNTRVSKTRISGMLCAI